MRPVRWATIWLAACCLAVTSSALADTNAAAPIALDPPTHVSRPGYTSYWAFVEQATPAYKDPTQSSHKVGHLGLYTHERTNELVLILQEQVNSRGEPWTQVRLPMLPNNTVGWVPSSTLGDVHHLHTHLIIDRRHFTATLIRAGKVVFRSRVGVGRTYWPTPRGEFYVRTHMAHAGGIYGSAAFGTSARSAVLTDWPGGGFIGLHGTDQPGLIPGRISHGCVRFHNMDISRLARMIHPGMPVTIR